MYKIKIFIYNNYLALMNNDVITDFITQMHITFTV